MSFLVDPAARQLALTQWVLPECLHVPVAAVNEAAIRSYIGEIEQVLAGGASPKALIVNINESPTIDRQLPIWELASSKILYLRRQVWVHIAFTRYRDAYRKAFPEESIDGKVLSHTMNRRVAALKGFAYVRITPTSRGCNSSSGFSEKWGVGLHNSPEQNAANRKRGAFIQYADLCDLMVMLDLKVGGGVMAMVNEGQKLVTPDPRGKV
jgi:hypothetical protein